MISGMLWLDDDNQRSLEEKVSRAVTYYRDKYGHAPDWCCVHLKALEDEIKIGQLTVRPDKYVLPQHLWLGVQQS